MPKLSVHVFGDGERVPMLHDGRGVPLFYPTLFATAQLRNSGVAVNTIRNKLADIVVLLRWEQLQRRDLVVEFTHGKFLSVSDVVSIRDFAKLDMRHQALNGADTDGSGITAADFLESRVELRRAEAAVGGQQHYNRLSTMADYIEFVASVVTQHRNSAQVFLEISQMAKILRKHRPRGVVSRNSDAPERRSPPSGLVNHFMEIGSEDHPRNPFGDRGIRLRNAIIFGLLRYTGMRRGELLSLRIDQFELGHEPQVWIRRNHDDAHDSRRYQPVAKTKERPLPLPQALADDIQRYIMEVRAKITPARRHPYLIVSHRNDSTLGRPLSTSALNSQIFGRMRSVDAAFRQIHPHAFRHHFNYELSASIDEHNAKVGKGIGDSSSAAISESRELDVRAFLNGHRNKASGAAYNHRHIREASDKAVRRVQVGLSGQGKASEGDNESS